MTVAQPKPLSRRSHDCRMATREHHHAPAEPPDDNGQGHAMVSFALAAHRAVVDVDPELGLVRVVQIATGQDVGKALDPLQVTGQIEGGIGQGVGEPPTISSTPDVVAAIRQAAGLPLNRVPVRPEDIALAPAECGS